MPAAARNRGYGYAGRNHVPRSPAAQTGENPTLSRRGCWRCICPGPRHGADRPCSAGAWPAVRPADRPWPHGPGATTSSAAPRPGQPGPGRRTAGWEEGCLACGAPKDLRSCEDCWSEACPRSSRRGVPDTPRCIHSRARLAPTGSGLKIFAEPKCVIDRGVRITLCHAVADAEQHVTLTRLAQRRLWLDREQGVDVDLAFVARAFLEAVVQLFIRAHTVLDHHLIHHPLLFGAGVFVLQHRHQLVAFAVDLLQHHVPGHDHFLGIHAAVVGRKRRPANGHARFDVIGDDLDLAAFVGQEVRHRHAVELTDGVVDQHVLAWRHLAVQHIPTADHQTFGRAPVFVLLKERMTAYGQHHHVRTQVEDGGRICSSAQAQVDFQTGQFQLEPARDTHDLVTLRSFRCGGNLPADELLLLEQGHVVPPLSGHPCRFHVRRTGTDHHDLAFHARGFLDDVRHAHVFTGGRSVLDAQHVQALVLTVDTVVGADALLDLVDLAHLDLGDQVRVSDVGAGHADHVDVAAFQNACGLVRVLDVLRVQDGRLDHFLDPGSQVQERLRWITHVGDNVGQGVVGITTRAHDTDEIDHAGGVVILGDFLHVLVAQAIGVEFIAADTNADAEVRADFLAHGLDHFQPEAHAIFEAAAPLIGALVDARAPELVDHVLVHSGQFNAVQATGLGAGCSAGIVADHAPDFFRFDGLAGRAVHRFTDARRRQQGRPVVAIPT